MMLSWRLTFTKDHQRFRHHLYPHHQSNDVTVRPDHPACVKTTDTAYSQIELY
jgi:hypothetical protein